MSERLYREDLLRLSASLLVELGYATDPRIPDQRLDLTLRECEQIILQYRARKPAERCPERLNGWRCGRPAEHPGGHRFTHPDAEPVRHPADVSH